MTTSRHPFLLAAAFALTLCGGVLFGNAARVQGQDSSFNAGNEPAGPSAMPIPEDPAAAGDFSVEAPVSEEVEGVRLNYWKLLLDGGVFMIPIGMLSLLVVTFAVERAIGLRRNKVLPKSLVEELGKLSASPGGFDPRKAYKLCQQYPSAASAVIRAMLLKVGRPHSEVEHTVSEASEREASRLYSNVRWLNLAAAVAPLCGLLGTVVGMIDAFHTTTVLPDNANMAEHLASGIYTALVTTLGGLVVAIPAAMVAHYFEGRIQTLFHQIDELLFNLLPQIERYEGRIRFSRHMSENDAEPRPASDEPLAHEAGVK